LPNIANGESKWVSGKITESDERESKEVRSFGRELFLTANALSGFAVAETKTEELNDEIEDGVGEFWDKGK
jgi:hypothetical protein